MVTALFRSDETANPCGVNVYKVSILGGGTLIDMTEHLVQVYKVLIKGWYP